MERQVKDYVYAALGFAVISLFGSLLSFLNIISLLTTYQFLLKARKRGINEKLDKIIEILFQASILFTICITVLYMSIKL